MGSHEEVSPEVIHKAIDPLPYFPTLCRLLGGVTISIVLVYLEIHHSAPEPDPATQPARAGLRIPPVYLDCDQACEDLGVSRRTLQAALESLGTWWKGEAQRSSASRAGRDFINTGRSFPASTYTKIKPLAIVGSRKHNEPRTLAIHRNPERLHQILVDSGIIASHNWAHNPATYATKGVTDTPAIVLESLLGVSAKRGLAWGWSQERVLAQSARMTELWAKRREKRS